MKLVAAALAIMFTLWSVLAVLSLSKGIAILTGCLAAVSALAFVSLAARDEYRKTSGRWDE